MFTYENGMYHKVTTEEEATLEINAIIAEEAYWENVDYDEAVNAEIRKKYSNSKELAILRQREEKPSEYAEYYSYCEECKAYVKAKKKMKEAEELYGEQRI